MNRVGDWFGGFLVRDEARRGGGVSGGGKYVKEFDRWGVRKKWLNGRKPVGGFSVREIWWMSCGVNVGEEVDGKGGKFTRPFLILKRVSPQNVLVLPMSKQVKNLPGYYRYGGGCILFEQVRVMNARRLVRKMKRMNTADFQKIKEAFVAYVRD